MSDKKPGETNLAQELKEFGRQLTETVKAVAYSDQVRTLGSELRDGLREATQHVETTLDKLNERDEVQRLRARATNVAESFKTGEAQREIREEVSEALQALNMRLRELVERFQTLPDQTATTTQAQHESTVATDADDKPYTGATTKL